MTSPRSEMTLLLQGDPRHLLSFNLLRGWVLLACLAFISGPLKAQTGLFINEALSSNGHALADEDGDHSDWIELRNTGLDTLDLTDFGLSDNPALPFKWRFPGIIMAPNSYLLVWASGKDRRQPGAPLHTNFSISAAGEALILTRPDGHRLDSLPPVTSRVNVSFGRGPDWKGGLRFFEEPTPGTDNTTQAFLGILEEPRLELTALGPDAGFRLVCSHPDSVAVIRFRLDGGVPREAGEEYLDTLHLSELPPSRLMHIPTNPWEAHTGGFGWHPPEGEFPAGLVVRARAYRPDFIPSLPVTVTHLDLEGDLPVLLLSVDSLDFFGDSAGIYVPGRLFHELGWDWTNPYGGHANYFQDGPAWERPAHLDIRMPGGARHQQHIGVRIHGGGTRALPQKSLRIYARGGYGLDHIPMDFFQDGRNQHRRLILRNSGQDAVFRTTMLRDAVIHQILSPLRLETQASRPSLVFLNGEFWGIHNIRERYDDDYLLLAYGIPTQDLDILENNLVPESGDYLHYHDLIQFLQAHDPAEDSVYAELCRRLDPDNYMDAQIAQIYSANYDWPGNNVIYWRKRTDQFIPDAPYGHDGRWRWMIKDTDMGFGLWDGEGYAFNMLEQATEEDGPDWPNPSWSTFLFRKTLRHPGFRDAFITRFCDLLNTAFHPHRAQLLLNRYAERIEPHMPLHLRRWQRPDSMEAWRSNLEIMRDFALKRPIFQRQHLREFFDLAEPAIVTLQVSHPDHGHIRINTVAIHPSTAGVPAMPWPWTGAYFQGLPIELEAIPAPGYRFTHWSGSVERDSLRLRMVPEEGSLFFIAHFEPDSSTTEGIPLHYWHFNGLPSGTITTAPSDLSLSGKGRITYPGNGPGYMDRVSEGSIVNAQEGVPSGRALRVRNPSDTRELLFEVPTTGYRTLTFSYAVTRTNNGATRQSLWLALDESRDWLPLHTDIGIADTFRLVSADLSDIPEAADNPWLAIRVLFEGPAAGGDEGNNRFDNVLLTGDPLSTTHSPEIQHPAAVFTPNPAQHQTLLNITVDREQSLGLTIIDATGRVMMTMEGLDLPAGTHDLPILVGDWPNGTYYAHLSSKGETAQVIGLVVMR